MKSEKLCSDSEETLIIKSVATLGYPWTFWWFGIFHLLLHIEIYCVRDFMLLYNPSSCNLNVLVLTVLLLCYFGI